MFLRKLLSLSAQGRLGSTTQNGRGWIALLLLSFCMADLFLNLVFHYFSSCSILTQELMTRREQLPSQYFLLSF